MAQATTLRYGRIAMMIGDGGSPEIFTAPCGLTTLDITTNVGTQTANVPDCDDPDIASWLAIDEVSRQKVLTGSGLLSAEYYNTWLQWDLAGGYKNVRVYYNVAVQSGGPYLMGSALLTTFTQTGQRGQKWQVNVGLTIDGKPSFVTG